MQEEIRAFGVQKVKSLEIEEIHERNFIGLDS